MYNPSPGSRRRNEIEGASHQDRTVDPFGEDSLGESEALESRRRAESLRRDTTDALEMNRQRCALTLTRCLYNSKNCRSLFTRLTSLLVPRQVGRECRAGGAACARAEAPGAAGGSPIGERWWNIRMLRWKAKAPINCIEKQSVCVVRAPSFVRCERAQIPLAATAHKIMTNSLRRGASCTSRRRRIAAGVKQVHNCLFAHDPVPRCDPPTWFITTATYMYWREAQEVWT